MRWLVGSLAGVAAVGAVAAEPVRLAVLVDPGVAADEGLIALGELVTVALANHPFRAATGSDNDAVRKLPPLELVERDARDHVLAEHALQAALQPAGLGARRKLGTLLRADLLLFLSPAPPVAADPQPPTVNMRALRVVVAESRGGLRLIHELTHWDPADPSATVDALLVAVDRARQRFAAEIEHVVAVPPFESDDFRFTHEHLMGAYAAIVEQALLTRPGTLVVELAEADALAREYQLADSPREVERPAPYYVLGQLQTHERAAGLTVDLELTLRRSGEPVATAARHGVPAVDAGRVLPALIAELVPRGWSPPTSNTNPKREAGFLRERADRFRLMGSWAPARDLYEASVLVDPTSLDARYRLVDVYARSGAFRTAAQVRGDGETLEAALARGLALHRHAWQHVEYVLRHWPGAESGTRLANWLTSFRSVIGDYYGLIRRHDGIRDAECVALLQQHIAFDRQVLLDAYEARLAEADVPREVLWLFRPGVLLLFGTGDLSPADDYAFRLRLAETLIDQPDVRLPLEDVLTWAPRRVLGLLGEDYLALLDDVAALPDARFAAIVDQVRREYERDRALRLKPTTRPTAPAEPPDPSPVVTLKRLELAVGKHETPIPRRWRAYRWLRCGDVDFVVGRDTWLMREPGLLEPVDFPPTDSLAANAYDVVFDGRYVWTSTLNADTPLICFDVQRNRVWRHLSDAALPPVRGAQLAVIRPGRIAVFGQFDRAGAKRGWIGLCTRQPDGTLEIDTVLEQRKQPLEDRWKSWDPDPQTARTASLVGTVTDPANPEKRYVVVNQQARLLVVEAATGELRVLPGHPRDHGDGHGVFTDGVYWIERTTWQQRTELRRARPPDFEPEDLLTINDGWVFGPQLGGDGALYIVGSDHIWRIPRPYKRAQRYRHTADIPGNYWWNIYPSAHYGTVLSLGDHGAFTLTFEARPNAAAATFEGPSATE